MRGYSWKYAVKDIMILMDRALQKNMNIGKFKIELKKLINSWIGLNRDERYKIFDETIRVYRACRASDDWRKRLSSRKVFDSILRTCRKCKASAELRWKKSEVHDALRDEKNIFFVCSKHNKPAKDHEAYQGKIYVDRFWRTKCKGDLYYAVQSYIKNHKTMSVQDVMKGPVWLTTRPYCKHWFETVDTLTVLHNSEKKISDSVIIKETLFSNKQYYEFRKAIYEKLEKEDTNKEFKRVIKNSNKMIPIAQGWATYKR